MFVLNKVKGDHGVIPKGIIDATTIHIVRWTVYIH
jgi:hypothetical protein